MKRSETDFIDVGGKGLPPNQPVGIEYLCDRLEVSNRTLVRYRQIAFQLIPSYRISALARNPQYLQKKVREMQRTKAGERSRPVMPDPPPFLPLEVNILEAIAALFSEFKSTALVKNYIQENPEFWRKFNNANHSSQQRAQANHSATSSRQPEDRRQSSDIVIVPVGRQS